MVVLTVAVAALMYANDIILISSSLLHAQRLIDICLEQFKLIDLSINGKKSSWLRIGYRFNKFCQRIHIGVTHLECSDSVNFLGSKLVSGSKFSVALDINKVKFFGNANKIFGKLGTSNVPVLMKLVESHCISSLLYNLEVVDLTKSQINSLNFALHRMYMKIFKTSSMEIVQLSLFNFGQLPIDLKLMLRKSKYLHKIAGNYENVLFFSLHKLIMNELNNLKMHWNTMGRNLHLPCMHDAWAVYAERLDI